MSNVVSQKEGVFNAVVGVVGSFSGAVELSTEQRKQVVATVVEGFESGTIELSKEALAKFNTTEKLKTYTQGLVSNWLRKDTRLNGGEKHITKNPGSRASKEDSAVNALRNLRKTLTDSTQIQQVDDEIQIRLAAIKAAKQPKIEVNINSIPENLRHLINS